MSMIEDLQYGRRSSRNILVRPSSGQSSRISADGMEGSSNHPTNRTICPTDKDEIILLHVEIPLWGTRVIIPKKLLAQDRILKTIHEGQIGVVKMKGLPRGHVRCLKDKDIERTGRQ